MINEKELMEKAIEEVIRRAVEQLTDEYHGRNTRKNIDDRIGEVVAKKYLEKHELDILKLIDIDTIAKVATLKVLSEIARKLG